MSQDLSAVIKNAIWHELSGKVHTALPGIVNSYDPTGPKVEVLPALKKVYLDGTILSYLPIVEVPVMFPRTNRFHLSFPLERGDTGLILFSERGLAEWLTGNGGEATPQDGRKFSLTDAMFLPGLTAFEKGHKILSGNNFELVFDDVKIVSNGKSFEFTGDVVVNGKIEATGDVKAGAISVQNHLHGNGTLSYLTPGSPTPVPVSGIMGVPQ